MNKCEKLLHLVGFTIEIEILYIHIRQDHTDTHMELIQTLVHDIEYYIIRVKIGNKSQLEHY